MGLLQNGEMAPDFSLPSTPDQKLSLSEFRGRNASGTRAPWIQSALDPESLLILASRLRLNLKAWRREMESEMTTAKILADFHSGVRSGVNGTPTFFVNGVRHDGDWSYEPFLEELKAMAEAMA